MEPNSTLARMKKDWNERARTDARFFIAKTSGSAEFENSAVQDVVSLIAGLDLSPDSRVLDLGCGIGRLIKPLAPKVGEIHGVDVSGEMIQRAREYLGDLSNVRLYENDGSDLSELRSDTYDFVYSYLMFQHIPDRAIVERYLSEVYRVTKVGGTFRFQIDGRGDRLFWRAYRAVRGHSSWRGVIWKRGAIAAATRDAGFEVVEHSVDTRKHGLMRYAYVWVTCVKRS